MERVDFHVHYENDKEFSPKNFFKEAKANEVVALALIGRLEISDNLDEFIATGKKFGIEVFSGVEYPLRINGQLVDTVSIGFDHKSGGIRQLFGKSERKRDNAQVARFQKKFLEDRGLILSGESEEDQNLLTKLLDGQISEKAILFCTIAARDSRNQTILTNLKSKDPGLWQNTYDKYHMRPGYTRPHNICAKFLWRMFFDFGKLGYLSIQSSAEDIIKAVHQAHGIVLYSPEGKFDRIIWQNLISQGIDGIMGWHGGKLEINRETILEARNAGLLILGGSDFHPGKNEWKVGVGDGSLFISPKRLGELKSYIRSNSNVYTK